MTAKNYRFQIAGGSVPGTDHTKPGEPFWRNNNDAYAFFQDEAIAIAIVTDGCGSPLAVQSEVGAHIITRLAISAIRRNSGELNVLPCGEHAKEPFVFKRIREDMLAEIRLLARAMGDSLTEVVNRYFLSTILGCVATRNKISFFSIGDGIFSINAELKTLGPFLDNEPPYLGYGIIGTKTAEEDSLQFKFKVTTQAIEEVKTVLIGTDGIEPFISHEKSMVPGLNEPVGNLSQFWTENKYFTNDDCVRRRLAQLNREAAITDAGGKNPRIQKGLLHDDAALIVLRKTPISSP